MADAPESGGFLARWGRRKTQARAGEVLADAPLGAATVLPLAPAAAAAEAPLGVGPVPVEVPVLVRPLPVEAPPLPTLADVALLTRDSDYARFVAGGVDEGVKRAAMKKLFSDPHFNVMDGLDIYIDDYSIADPIPLAMLREMNQSKALKLFEEEDETQSALVPDERLALTAPAEATEEPAVPADLAEANLANAANLVDLANAANPADPANYANYAKATEPKRAI